MGGRKRQVKLGPVTSWWRCSEALVANWVVFILLKADTHGRHPSTLGHSHPDEQRHAHAGARRGVRVRVSGREGLHQLLLLFRRLPLRSLAAWQVAHPHRQDRLVRTHLLPHCIWSLQPGLLGLLSLSLGPGVNTSHSLLHSTYALCQQGTFWRRGPTEIPNDLI